MEGGKSVGTHINRASATMSKVAPDAGGGKPRKVVILQPDPSRGHIEMKKRDLERAIRERLEREFPNDEIVFKHKFARHMYQTWAEVDGGA